MSGRLRPHDYPPDWDALRLQVLARAGDACECRGECGAQHERDGSARRCNAPHHAEIIRDLDTPARWWLATSVQAYRLVYGAPRIVRVVLTVAHLCQDSGCADLDHLRAMCARCHLVYDQAQHTRNAAATRRARLEAAGQLSLFGGTP